MGPPEEDAWASSWDLPCLEAGGRRGGSLAQPVAQGRGQWGQRVLDAGLWGGRGPMGLSADFYCVGLSGSWEAGCDRVGEASLTWAISLVLRMPRNSVMWKRPLRP